MAYQQQYAQHMAAQSMNPSLGGTSLNGALPFPHNMGMPPILQPGNNAERGRNKDRDASGSGRRHSNKKGKRKQDSSSSSDSESDRSRDSSPSSSREHSRERMVQTDNAHPPQQQHEVLADIWRQMRDLSLRSERMERMLQGLSGKQGRQSDLCQWCVKYEEGNYRRDLNKTIPHKWPCPLHRADGSYKDTDKDGNSRNNNYHRQNKGRA